MSSYFELKNVCENINKKGKAATVKDYLNQYLSLLHTINHSNLRI